MIESMMGIKYGKITTEVGYKDGKETHQVKIISNSLPIADRTDMMKQIFSQLQTWLDNTEQVATFELHKDPKTHEPCRMVIISKETV